MVTLPSGFRSLAPPALMLHGYRIAALATTHIIISGILSRELFESRMRVSRTFQWSSYSSQEAIDERVVSWSCRKLGGAEAGARVEDAAVKVVLAEVEVQKIGPLFGGTSQDLSGGFRILDWASVDRTGKEWEVELTARWLGRGRATESVARGMLPCL